ncbi:MAG: trimethylamine methyltransferase family protein [Actinobacteria bacterium]|nr:trimethylamine methyltransferase family protein [Actinomycetota bacterium]MCL5071524.1 trimethylamine methyltransferase family protein [Actinomycetota bacterium]
MITAQGVVPIKGGQFKVLSEEQIKDLHDATVEVLENIGIKNLHDEAREIMESNGCKVDHDNKIVKIPEAVLMDNLKKAPANITLYGRDPKYDVHLSDSDDVYVMGGAGAVNTLGLDGVLRPSTFKDMEDFTRLEDTLENMDIAHFLVIPTDTEFGTSSECEMLTFAHMLTNNTRNFYALLGGCREGLSYELEMASVLAGSIKEVSKRPFFVAGLCIISPLTHRKDFIEELFECGKYKIPCYVEADATAGGTTPYTIAGCLVEVNANILGAISLAQMANPGAPCIYSSSSGILDMKSLYFSGNAPEATLLHMASAQMAHFYKLPYYGSNTADSKLPDEQAGYERAQHFLGCALGGVNIIHVAIGNLAMMTVANYEQCLIDNEILGASFRLLQGIDTSKDAIGIDAFYEAGHIANFIQTRHTVKYCRSNERWIPKLTDRGNWNQWMTNTGGKDMRERAKDMAKKILEEHYPVYVNEDQKKEIWKIAKEGQKFLAERAKKRM